MELLPEEKFTPTDCFQDQTAERGVPPKSDTSQAGDATIMTEKPARGNLRVTSKDSQSATPIQIKKKPKNVSWEEMGPPQEANHVTQSTTGEESQENTGRAEPEYLPTNINNPTPKTDRSDFPNSVLNKRLTKLQRVKSIVGDSDSIISEHSEEGEEDRVGNADEMLGFENFTDENPWVDGMVDPVSPDKSHFTFLGSPTEVPRMGTPGFGSMSKAFDPYLNNKQY
jgi:hypothetical protein